MRTKRTTRCREDTASNVASDRCPILAPAQFIHNRLFQRITLRSTTNLWVLPTGRRVIMRARCVARRRDAGGKNYGRRLSPGTGSPCASTFSRSDPPPSRIYSLFPLLFFPPRPLHSAPFIASAAAIGVALLGTFRIRRIDF